MTIYRLYIRPILTYAGVIVQNAPKTHFNRLQIMQNKCLRMALSKKFFTRTTELHSIAKISTIREFIDKNARKFYEKTLDHENPLIKPLGDYTVDSVPFKIKHRLPRGL